jgi:hypothetical protein
LAKSSPPPWRRDHLRRGAYGLHLASVLARCGFAQVAKLTDPDEGPVWRWELRLDDHAGQHA